MSDTYTGVMKVLCDVLTIAPERILPDTNIADDLKPDSLEQVEIFIGLESEFNLSLTEDEGWMGTVANAVERIDAELAKLKDEMAA